MTFSIINFDTNTFEWIEMRARDAANTHIEHSSILAKKEQMTYADEMSSRIFIIIYLFVVVVVIIIVAVAVNTLPAKVKIFTEP